MGFEGTDVRNGSGPVYPIFRCRDGYVRLIVLSTPQWRAMRAWLGEPEYLQDEEYDTFPGRFAISDAVLNPLYEELFADMSVETVSEQAQARGIVCTPVLDPARVLTNEHFASRGTFMDLEVAPGVVARAASGYFEFDGERAGPTAPASGRGGAHRPGVLAALGEARTGAPLPEPALPLAGLRVMDFGQGAVGVEAGKLFAEYGADVLKIESRKHYDFIRVITGIEMGPSFASSSRSKRGRRRQRPRAERARPCLHELAKLSDVVIENVHHRCHGSAGHRLRRPVGGQPRDRHGRQPAHGLAGPLGRLAGLRARAPRPRAACRSCGATRARRRRPAPRRSSPTTSSGGCRPSARWPRSSAAGAAPSTGGFVEVAQVEAVTGVISDLLAAESLEPGSVRAQGIHTERGTPGCASTGAPATTSGSPSPAATTPTGRRWPV